MIWFNSPRTSPPITIVGKEFQIPQETDLPDINSDKVTERINATALELLHKHPEGLSWTDLKTRIQESDPKFHPKTVNGCVWKLVEKYPDRVYKPSKGLFRLRKDKSE